VRLEPSGVLLERWGEYDAVKPALTASPNRETPVA
jgi:hypothetical protein